MTNLKIKNLILILKSFIFILDRTGKKNLTCIDGRKPSDYIRREAILRIKHLEIKKNIETQILKSQLRSTILEEERSKILLEKAKLESEVLKKSLQ